MAFPHAEPTLPPSSQPYMLLGFTWSFLPQAGKAMFQDILSSLVYLFSNLPTSCFVAHSLSHLTPREHMGAHHHSRKCWTGGGGNGSS